MEDLTKTRVFSSEDMRREMIRSNLKTVINALNERGYNAVHQIAGYLISNDPAYISSHKNARNIIQQVERDEIIEELVKSYFGERIMKKVLGLDLGSRTCGIAMSDILGMIAHGVETFRFKPDDYLTCAKHVKEIVEENEIETIVLGLPKHMNGDIGERGQISIEFKKQLEEMIEGINVILVDERLTTVVAENQLLFADVSRKKRKQVIDKMAAVAILQGYLDRG